jgi:hypothetical protein
MLRSRLGRKSLVLALSLTALAGAATAPAQSPAAIKLGVHTPGAPGDATTLDAYASMVGRKPDIVNIFRDLTAPFLYSNEIANLASRGQTAMVSWEPFDSSGRAIPLARIADGTYDAQIRAAAGVARGLGKEVLVRFAHEMNLLSSPWGPGKSGNDAAGYVRAWQHVVSIFRQEGATNARWVWSPNVDYGGRPFSSFFPGDAWVDYVALDGYNWGSGSAGERWTTFADVFLPSYRTITQLSGKPVIIAETSSSEAGGSKAGWILDGMLRTIPQQMPRVYAVVWFNRVQEDDWRVNSTQTSLDAYRVVVASSLYGGTAPPNSTWPTPAPGPTAPAPSPNDAAPAPTPPRGGGIVRGIGNSFKPVVRAVHVTRRVAGRRLHGRFRYRLSEKATVRVVIQRSTDGGRFRRRFVTRRSSHAGMNRIGLRRLLRRHHMRAGAYRAVVRAVDRDGNRSRTRRVGFRVLAKR